MRRSDLTILMFTLVGFTMPEAAEAACGDGILDLGETCDDGGTESGDGCTSQCVEEFCVRNLGPMSAFNVFAFEDYVGGVDVAGRVAAGRDVEMTGFRVGYELNRGLVVTAGNDLRLNYGTVHGNAVYGNAFDTLDPYAVSFTGTGSASQGSAVDFANAEAVIFGTSTNLAALTPNGTVYTNAYDNVGLVGFNPGFNVFSMTTA